MLSIIIVNFRTPKLLAECLETVYDQTRSIAFEVIVVDNDSGDNSEKHILNLYPSVKWIQMAYNSGFARANNEGIRQSSGDAVLLLNSDTLVTGNAIAECYKLFTSSEYVACGVQLLNRDGSPQISGNFVMTGGLNNLLPLPFIGPFLKGLGNLVNVSKPHVPDANEPVEVHWINGAYLMVKRDIIKKAGLMDEDFFLYAEEAEWCHRLRKYGKLAIFGQYKVIHLQGETSNTAFTSQSSGYYNLYDRKGLQIMLSNFVRLRKEFGVFWFLFHLLVYTIAIPVFIVGTIFRIIFFVGKPREFSSVGSYTLNVLNVWSYLFRILINRPYFYKIL
jgi:GT2 family glycosyltransferase